MNALISSMAGLALIASGAVWAAEHKESQGSQGQKPFKSSETYAPSDQTDPGMTEGQTSQGKGQVSESSATEGKGQASERSATEGKTNAQGKAQPQTTGESEQSGAGQYVDDAMITAKVKAALAKNPGTSAMAISVETTDQTVQLTGSVESEDEKEKAESIARGVTGVKDVENQLTIEG